MNPVKLMVMSVITAFLMAVACPAYATLVNPFHAEAGADIDYSTFEISFTGTGAAFGAYFESAAQGTGHSRVTDTLKVELGSEFSSFYALAETDVNEPGMDYQDMRAFTQVADVPLAGRGIASAGYFGRFQAESAGTLTISTDYYLYASAYADNDRMAIARAMAFLTINGEEVFDGLEFMSLGGNGYDMEKDWTRLTISYDLAAGQIVDFSALAGTDVRISNVPVSGAVWLLGTGFAGLFGIRKNQRA